MLCRTPDRALKIWTVRPKSGRLATLAHANIIPSLDRAGVNASQAIALALGPALVMACVVKFNFQLAANTCFS